MSEPVETPGGAPRLEPEARPPQPPPGGRVAEQLSAEAWPVSRSDRPDDPQVYRPLSLAAVIGFGLAVLYAVVVTFIAVAAVWRGVPVLWPLTSLLFPLAAATVCGLAWLMIQRSEGTRAGSSLAVWGIMLALGFGLSYTAYYVAKYLAIRKQSTDFARAWLERLTRGEVEEAYSETYLPERRPDKPDKASLRDWLPAHNPPDPRSGLGAYDRFAQMPMVQLLRQAGSQTEIQPLGLSSWDYVAGGYQVIVNYRVTTPEATWDMPVTLFGTERRGAEGRQWNIHMPMTGPKEDTLTYTFYGRIMAEARRQAASFLAEWRRKIQESRWLEAYWDTLEADQRFVQSSQYAGSAVLANLATLQVPLAVAVLADPGTYLPGFREFGSGGYVVADPNAFPKNDPLVAPETILPEVREIVRLSNPPPTVSFNIDKAGEPWVRENNRLRIPASVQITLPGDRQVLAVMMAETPDGPLFKALENGESPERLQRLMRAMIWKVQPVRIVAARALGKKPTTPEGKPRLLTPPSLPNEPRGPQ